MELRKPLYEEEKSFQIKIPWDKYSAIGLAGGTAFLLVLIFWLAVMPFSAPRKIILPDRTVPLTLLNFGDGDGTGLSKGNLTKEGRTHKGKESNSQLEDAKRASETKFTRDATTTDISEAENFIPVEKVSSDVKDKPEEGGSDRYNVGSPDGLTDATGLGSRGSGKGAGLGFGDIEWGGGGNRTVLYKTLPKFPDGVRTSAHIKMRFTVMPDGTVGKITPLQKADPRLEQAAKDALSKWRFNPLNEDIVMVGTIPLTFRLR
jgi:TonB family protein